MHLRRSRYGLVSGRKLDNTPPAGQEDGWISHFVQNLRTETNRRMGRADDYDLWMDFKLKTSDAVTPEIDKQLGDASVLIILMSRGWLRSEWCIKELDIFCRHHPEAVNKSQIFVIDQDGLPREEKPQRLHDLLTIPFYQTTSKEQIRQLGYPFPQSKNPNHQPYFDRVVDLFYHLRDVLEPIGNAPNFEPATAPEAAAEQSLAYVAPVNDTLHDQRISLISELQQYGIKAIPALNRHEPDIESRLAECSNFVQLLDDNYALSGAAPLRTPRIAHLLWPPEAGR